ncbi:hypothetical protein VQ056_27285 [Paenibacillus sp. JTLBN-2024]
MAQTIGFYFDFRVLLKAGAGGIVMTVTSLAAHRFLERMELGQTIALIGALLVSILAYLGTLQLTRALRSGPKTPTMTPVS